MNRVTRSLVASVAALALVGVVAPATMAAGAANHAQSAKAGNSKDTKKDKGKKHKVAAKALQAKKVAVTSAITNRDAQLTKALKDLNTYEFTVIGAVDAKAAVAANIAKDRAVLTALKAKVLASKDVSVVARAAVVAKNIRVGNYEEVSYLLDWADLNSWYIEDLDGVESVRTAITAAVAQLVTVTAFTGKNGLVSAEKLLEQSDDLIDSLDGTDGVDDSGDDDTDMGDDDTDMGDDDTDMGDE